MEKLRWLISDIFEKLRDIDIIIGVKFENINSLKISENILYISFYRGLFGFNEINYIKEILFDNFNITEAKFQQDKEKILYPYPVVNSKFNNFITEISIEQNEYILEFFQKDNKKHYEKCKHAFRNINEFLTYLSNYTLKKVNLLEELYRYNQVILPFELFEEEIAYITEKWESFRRKENIIKFVDKIYFNVKGG